MSKFTPIIVIILSAVLTTFVQAQAPTTNAADLYAQAAGLLKATSPANSNLEYPTYPPLGAEWDKLAGEAWDANAPARRLVHEAVAIEQASWPDDTQLAFLNGLRTIGNEVSDAALYAHLQGDDAAAVESIRDLLHLANLLDGKSDKSLVRVLVAGGLHSVAYYRLTTIISDIKLTAARDDARAVQVKSARALIDSLLDQQDPATRLAIIVPPEAVYAGRERAIRVLNRNNAERTMAAMSLACHIYKFEKRTWPASLDALVPAYLPRVPVDPWGDGKQLYGYVLIKGALPDGSDRPLVYERDDAADGLMYRADEPQYHFYFPGPADVPPAQRKHTGQFRDVASWTPPKGIEAGAVLKPLP